jgi:hypothetical protein
MWDCDGCGCRAIAGSLACCPVCGKEREDMAKTTTGGGRNAGAQPGESGYVEPEAPEASPADVAEPPAAEPDPPAAPVTPKAAKPAKAVSEPSADEPEDPPEITSTGSLRLSRMGGSGGE